MIRLDDHLTEIKETQRQISNTSRIQRKRDLSKHLKKLWKEYKIAQAYLKQEDKWQDQNHANMTNSLRMAVSQKSA